MSFDITFRRSLEFDISIKKLLNLFWFKTWAAAPIITLRENYFIQMTIYMSMHLFKLFDDVAEFVQILQWWF